MTIFLDKVLFLVCVMNFYSLNFSCMCCSCCAKDTNGFLIDFVTNKYEPTYFHKEQIKKCEVCLCGINHPAVMVVCGTQKTHVLCLDCFFRGFCSADDFVNFDMPVYKCPFGNCGGGVTLIVLKHIFIEGGLFKDNTEDGLKNIRSLLKDRTGIAEGHSLSLEELKQQFQCLNKDLNIISYKPCPCCNVSIFKESGCNLMACVVCGCKWCWLCGWFSFRLHASGYEHFGCRDCVDHTTFLKDGHDDSATYYGTNYLYGNAEYQKPRFFKHHRYLDSDASYNSVKERITQDKYQIENFINMYDPTYLNVSGLLLPINPAEDVDGDDGLVASGTKVSYFVSRLQRNNMWSNSAS